MIKRVLAVIFILIALVAWIGVYVLIPILIIIILFLIRFLADIFWWGRDRGKW